ncbi:hypothetical protein K431DRAFT_339635 [Polychaeton citri CBS 116435]|uniref:DUF1993 domain-containing protein n=1 Tax=Polychaeton citri CBS 116435 TaxID=1314669 RepID=A0A9P4UP58_9PEZI|nr:hypothetical protein K431DRAFT_339635 [Polychaeton citri CBS 116435]
MASLYDFTVAVYIHGLEQLQHVLKKGEEWSKENGKPEDFVVGGRIIEDMHAMPFQVQICCNTAKNTCTRVAKLDLPSVEDNEKTLPELYARIEKTIQMLKGIDRSAFDGTETREVNFKAGKYDLKMEGISYAQRFALPNFFFHLTTAYNILRKAGVPLGKGDFLGQIA